VVLACAASDYHAFINGLTVGILACSACPMAMAPSTLDAMMMPAQQHSKTTVA
jgi:hypothetical protein